MLKRLYDEDDDDKQKKDNVCNFGVFSPSLAVYVKRNMGSWHTRWFIFVTPKAKKVWTKKKFC